MSIDGSHHSFLILDSSRPYTHFKAKLDISHKYLLDAVKICYDELPNRRVYVTETLPSSPSSATSTSILAKAVATTHLSWWQLLALVLGAFLVLIVGIWLWWCHREKIKVEEAKKKEEIEERERKRIASEKQKELVERLGVSQREEGKEQGGGE